LSSLSNLILVAETAWVFREVKYCLCYGEKKAFDVAPLFSFIYLATFMFGCQCHFKKEKFVQDILQTSQNCTCDLFLLPYKFILMSTEFVAAFYFFLKRV